MRQPAVTALIFDLDGTIINSLPDIQKAFNAAYSDVYNQERIFDIKTLIGPPIKNIFSQLTGEQDIEKINAFVTHFQQRYDSEHYKGCCLYPDFTKLFSDLTARKNIRLFIATNKRLAPTLLILDHLNIKHLFKGIYCIDSVQPSFANKTEMVRYLLKEENLNPAEILFIGDTEHDQAAAENNNLKFIYADYGFGELHDCNDAISHSSEIINYL